MGEVAQYADVLSKTSLIIFIHYHFYPQFLEEIQFMRIKSKTGTVTFKTPRT